MEPPLFSIVSSSVRFENLAKVSLIPLPESGHNTGAWPSGGRRIVWQQFAERRWRPWRRRLELRPSEWDDLLLSVRLLPVVNTTHTTTVSAEVNNFPDQSSHLNIFVIHILWKQSEEATKGRHNIESKSLSVALQNNNNNGMNENV